MESSLPSYCGSFHRYGKQPSSNTCTDKAQPSQAHLSLTTCQLLLNASHKHSYHIYKYNNSATNYPLANAVNGKLANGLCLTSYLKEYPPSMCYAIARAFHDATYPATSHAQLTRPRNHNNLLTPGIQILLQQADPYQDDIYQAATGADYQQHNCLNTRNTT